MGTFKVPFGLCWRDNWEAGVSRRCPRNGSEAKVSTISHWAQAWEGVGMVRKDSFEARKPARNVMKPTDRGGRSWE